MASRALATAPRRAAGVKASDEFEADMKALAERYGVLIEPVYFDLTDAAGVKAGVRTRAKERGVRRGDLKARVKDGPKAGRRARATPLKRAPGPRRITAWGYRRAALLR